MVVARLPRFVQEILRPLARSLTRPQRRHLGWIVAAILFGAVPKLRHLARHAGTARHRTSLSKFLSQSEWDECSLLAAQAQRVLRALQLRKGETIDLLIDDTRIVKRARTMADVGKLWDHCHGRFARGHIMVTAAIVVRGLTLPWALRLWRPRKQAGAAYVKLTDLAAELVRAFAAPAGVKVRVLFDAFYLCRQVTEACESRGFTWYSVAAKNRRFWRARTKRFAKLCHFGPGLVKHSGRRVRMRRASGWRWLRIASELGGLPKIGAVQVVFSKRPREPWHKLLAVVTNDLAAKPREVIERYERRWQIEVLFKELREMGLGAYQLQHRNGIRRHLHLVCLAHLLLTHHAVQALGAQAKKPCRRIPVPPLRTRWSALRQAMRDDQVHGFTKRIRTPRLRKRVREFLKMAA